MNQSLDSMVGMGNYLMRSKFTAGKTAIVGLVSTTTTTMDCALTVMHVSQRTMKQLHVLRHKIDFALDVVHSVELENTR